MGGWMGWWDGEKGGGGGIGSGQLSCMCKTLTARRRWAGRGQAGRGMLPSACLPAPHPPEVSSAASQWVPSCHTRQSSMGPAAAASPHANSTIHGSKKQPQQLRRLAIRTASKQAATISS